MRTRTLCAAAGAVGLALVAAPAAAAPLSSSLALTTTDTGTVEAVRWVRGAHGRHWIGPAAGLAFGSALAPRYYEYGYYHPGYGAYARAPQYVPPRRYFGRSFCTGEASADSAFPSGTCPHTR